MWKTLFEPSRHKKGGNLRNLRIGMFFVTVLIGCCFLVSFLYVTSRNVIRSSLSDIHYI